MAFALLAAIFGLFFALATPPLQVPDETRHLARIFALTDGQILAHSPPGEWAHVSVPRSVVELERELGAERLYRHPARRQDRDRLTRALRSPLDPMERVEIRLPSLYSPLPYLPQVLAVGAARRLGASAAACVYAGRLGAWLFTLAAVTIALRRAPAHLFALGMLATTPMALFEGASLAADAVTNGLAFVFCASVLRSAAGSGPLSRAEIVELSILAAGIGLSKQAYAPLAAAVAIIPAARFASGHARARSIGIILAAAALPSLFWLAALRTLSVAPLVASADPAAQVEFILSHPLDSAAVFARTLVQHFERYVRTFVGQLGYLDVRLPASVYALYPIVLLAVCVADGGKASPVRGWARGAALGLAGLTWLAILVFAYIGWNEPGDAIVRYVQGRYFIPLAPFIAIAIHAPGTRGLPPPVRWASLTASAALLLTASVLLFQRYWGPPS